MTPQEALAAALQSLDNGERDVPDADALGFAAAILPALSAAGYSIVSTEELEGLVARGMHEMNNEWAMTEMNAPIVGWNGKSFRDEARELIARAALEGAKP